MTTNELPTTTTYRGFEITVARVDYSYGDVEQIRFAPVVDGEQFSARGLTAEDALVEARKIVDRTIANSEIRPLAIAVLEFASEAASWAPLTEAPAVGSIVGIYSRGQVRPAIVEKVTKTKVHAAYVTRGGIDEAARYGHLPTITRKSDKLENVVAPVIRVEA